MWQQQGVLPMLHHWMHSQGVAQRLLALPDGERQLSNLLHLGELLQHAAQSLQGEHALVRFLGEQIHSPTESTDAQKMRLETDAQCVQVITYHKSKGLQFPLVFIPFAGSFRTETSGKNAFATDDDDGADAQATSSVDEDMRLLYVALTRAQKALWLGVSETHNDISGTLAKGSLNRSALSRLLNRLDAGHHSELRRIHKDFWPAVEFALDERDRKANSMKRGDELRNGVLPFNHIASQRIAHRREVIEERRR
jgi:exodeoxyribonuclease V beta subunit